MVCPPPPPPTKFIEGKALVTYDCVPLGINPNLLVLLLRWLMNTILCSTFPSLPLPAPPPPPKNKKIQPRKDGHVRAHAIAVIFMGVTFESYKTVMKFCTHVNLRKWVKVVRRKVTASVHTIVIKRMSVYQPSLSC